MGPSVLKTFYTNIRSVKGKTTEIQALNEYDIICLTETHLDSTFYSGEILDQQKYSIYRKDRNLRGGGVLIAIRTTIPHVGVVGFPLQEAVAVVINNSTILLCVYRPPSNEDKRFLEGLLEELERNVARTSLSCSLADSLIIIGDLNYPGINWAGHSPVVKSNARSSQTLEIFMNTLSEYGLIQMIQEPTHTHGNTLDLIMSNTKSTIRGLQVYPPEISDHSSIVFSIHMAMCKLDRESFQVVYSYKNINMGAYVDKMDRIHNELKESYEAGGDVDYLWSYFETRLSEAISVTVPKRIVKIGSRNQWITRNITKSSKKLKQLYTKYKATGEERVLQEYRQGQRLLRKQVRKQKREHIMQNIVEPLSVGDSKPFFRYIKAMYKTASHLDLIKIDGEEISDPAEIANELNKFFTSQFNTQHQLQESSNPEIVNLCIQGERSDTIKIQPKGIVKLVKELKAGKAPGPDGLTPAMLKISPDVTSECLALIMNRSFQTGQVPKAWKQSNIIPIHKGGPKELGNYRPISLTSIPCKITEHMVVKELNCQLDKILSTSQHGFRAGLSCETQLVLTYHDICKNVDQGRTVHGLVLDFRKAFDMVPHGLIIKKLQMDSFNNHIVSWISNFLTARTQRVIVKGQVSSQSPVTSGVPQGSVIGPKLFLLYINDLPQCIKSNVSLFADDTFIYRVVNSQEDVKALQKDIQAVERWSDEWLMPFNAGKTQVICFGKTKITMPAQYSLGGSIIQEVQSVKYLGVIFSSNLSFGEHITGKIKKAMQTLGLLKRALWNMPRKTKLTAYKALCRPILEYAAVVWDPHVKKNSYSSEMVQNRAIRFIAGMKGRDESITEARNLLSLDSLEHRRKQARLRLINKMLGSGHPILSDFLDNETLPTNPHETRSTTQHLLPSLQAQTNTYHYSFLPRTIRDLRSTEDAHAPYNPDHN